MTIAASWQKEQVDLAELARLRWVEKQKIERIATRLGMGTTTVKRHLRHIKTNPHLIRWGPAEQKAMRKIRGR